MRGVWFWPVRVLLPRWSSADKQQRREKREDGARVAFARGREYRWEDGERSAGKARLTHSIEPRRSIPLCRPLDVQNRLHGSLAGRRSAHGAIERMNRVCCVR